MEKTLNMFRDAFTEDMLLFNEPMKNHTSFRVGGSASLLFLPKDSADIIKAIEICRKQGVNCFVMGNGSNLLVSDEGYKGVIIKISRGFDEIIVEGDIITAKAGAMLSSVSRAAYDNSLCGFEFAQGIPGTIGGAVTMNAGAYKGEIKDSFVKATVLEISGEKMAVKELDLNKMQFDYRRSAIQKGGLVVLDATLKLKHGAKEDIKALMDEYAGLRRTKQPLELPSAGSTFKRPVGKYAGELIENAGLKGFAIGGAAVSDKHAGFVVNLGNATASDILQLIEHIKVQVKNKFDVILEPEVKIL